MALLQIFVYLLKVQKSLDFIKHYAIRKLAYKDKYIDHIKKVLITFFGNSKKRFFELVGLINAKKKEYKQHSSVIKVLR